MKISGIGAKLVSRDVALSAKSIKAIDKLADEVSELVQIMVKTSDDANLSKIINRGESSFSSSKSLEQTLKGETSPKQTSAFYNHPHNDSDLSVTSPENHVEANSSSKNHNDESIEKTEDTIAEGCPVSTVTGEELLTIEDVTLPGDLPFTFKRTYRTSSCDIKSEFGYGWSHSLSHRLEFEDDIVKYIDDENKTTQYPIPTEISPSIINNIAKSGIFLSQKDNEFIISKDDGNYYYFEREDGVGKLIKIVDKYNNALLVNYLNDGKISSIVNPTGVGLFFVYDNRLVTQLHYKAKNPSDPESTWVTESVKQAYQYNAAHQLISNRNESDIGEDYDYDDLNVISLRRMAGGVEFYWEWIGEGKNVKCGKHWSNTGYSTIFTWNDDEHHLSIEHSDGSLEEYQYDDNAKLIKKVDPDGAESQSIYDKSGNLVKEIDALGNETTHVYENNLRVASINPEGKVVQFRYIDGNLFRIIDGKKRWRFLYNEFGDLCEKQDPEGNDTYYKYNDNGKLTLVTYSDGSKHSFKWNKLGMLISETYPDGSDLQYRYDIFGRVIYQRSKVGGTTQYSWDASDNLIKVVKPDGSSQRFTYNGYGKVTSVEDEKGLITTYEYFENSHLVSKVINPDGSSLSYRYENAKNFVSHITNERGETYQIDYFPNGLVSKETTFDGRSLAYTYDLNGKLLSKVETGTNGTEL